VKTTVYLGADDYRRIKILAETEGRSAAELIRAAVSDYVARRQQAAWPSSIGMARGGGGDLSERAEELLEGMGGGGGGG